MERSTYKGSSVVCADYDTSFNIISSCNNKTIDIKLKSVLPCSLLRGFMWIRFPKQQQKTKIAVKVLWMEQFSCILTRMSKLKPSLVLWEYWLGGGAHLKVQVCACFCYIPTYCVLGRAEVWGERERSVQKSHFSARLQFLKKTNRLNNVLALF